MHDNGENDNNTRQAHSQGSFDSKALKQSDATGESFGTSHTESVSESETTGTGSEDADGNYAGRSVSRGWSHSVTVKPEEPEPK